MVKDSNLYDILGISTEASDVDIKRAFIKLSKKWHPDKHSEEMKEEASKKFKEMKTFTKQSETLFL